MAADTQFNHILKKQKRILVESFGRGFFDCGDKKALVQFQTAFLFRLKLSCALSVFVKQIFRIAFCPANIDFVFAI